VRRRRARRLPAETPSTAAAPTPPPRRLPTTSACTPRWAACPHPDEPSRWRRPRSSPHPAGGLNSPSPIDSTTIASCTSSTPHRRAMGNGTGLNSTMAGMPSSTEPSTTKARQRRRRSAQPRRHDRSDRRGRGLPVQRSGLYVNGQVRVMDWGFEASGVGLPTLRRSRRSAGASPVGPHLKLLPSLRTNVPSRL
jgi:hypothetical protein